MKPCPRDCTEGWCAAAAEGHPEECETMRQYVSCEFRPGDRRTYTYHNDGDPVDVGDEVRVESARGEVVVKVVGVWDKVPSFATKPILGRKIADKLL